MGIQYGGIIIYSVCSLTASKRDKPCFHPSAYHQYLFIQADTNWRFDRVLVCKYATDVATTCLLCQRHIR